MVKKSVVLGLIGGGALILLVLLTYIIDRQFMGNMVVGITFMLIAVTWTIIAAKRVKKHLGGVVKLGQALLSVILIGLTMTIISSAFNVLIYKVIDTELQADIIEQQVEFWLPIMDGAPDEAIEQTIKGIEEGIMGQTSIKGILQTILNSVIFYAVLGLIVALVIRTKEKKTSALESL